MRGVRGFYCSWSQDSTSGLSESHTSNHQVLLSSWRPALEPSFCHLLLKWPWANQLLWAYFLTWKTQISYQVIFFSLKTLSTQNFFLKNQKFQKLKKKTPTPQSRICILGLSFSPQDRIDWLSHGFRIKGVLRVMCSFEMDSKARVFIVEGKLESLHPCWVNQHPGSTGDRSWPIPSQSDKPQVRALNSTPLFLLPVCLVGFLIRCP